MPLKLNGCILIHGVHDSDLWMKMAGRRESGVGAGSTACIPWVRTSGKWRSDGSGVGNSELAFEILDPC
jgi:hypothetical protein